MNIEKNIVKHDETEVIIMEMGDKLKQIYDVILKQNNALGEILSNSNLSESGKSLQRENVIEKNRDTLTKYTEELMKMCEKASVIEKENAIILEMNDEWFVNAMETVVKVGKNIANNNKEAIINHVTGNYQLQLILKRLFDDLEIKYEPFVFEYEKVFDDLKESIITLMMDKEKESHFVKMVEVNLNNVLKGIGSDTRLDLNIDDTKYLDSRARAVMGLSV